MKDFYYILGITSNATPAEVNAAYRKLARRFQSDDNAPDDFLESRFWDIKDAYTTLSDPEKRRKYNAAFKKYQQNKLYHFKVSYLSIAATLALITFTALFGWYVIRSITKVKKAPMQKVTMTAPVAIKHHKKRHMVSYKPVKLVMVVSKAPSQVQPLKEKIKLAVLKQDTVFINPPQKPAVAQLPAATLSLGYTVNIQANVTGVANLHKLASYSSDVVATIPNHARVRVLEKGDSFYKVAFNEQTGYLPKWVIPKP